jgi:hypothetical protein
MRVREMMGCLLGSAVIYVAMAACSGNDSPPPGAVNGQGGGSGSSGISQGGGSPSGGMWDAMTDPVPNASADPVSGSRLKAQYRMGSDGSKGYIMGLWHDSQRHEDCTFAMAADGVERCLPSGLGIVAFSDAACTQPLAMDNSGCTSKYAIKRDPPTGCNTVGPAHIYELAAASTVTNIYFQAGTQCISTPAPMGGTLYSVGAEVPATAFVQGTIQTDP